MSTALANITDTRMSSAQLIEQRKAIVEAMEKTMKPGIDFGIIPGTPKPTLYKPGSEKILALFHLAAQPTVEDISTPDCIRYRLHITVTHAPTGGVVGFGIGEASSAESKYQWRAVVCDEEWAATPEDRRREKWKKGDRNAYLVRQVRADMDDVANTILKMAKKRAQIDAVLTTTAASDIFAQDLEDLKAAGLDPEDENQDPEPRQSEELQRKPAAQATTAPAAAGTGAKITEAQGKQFWAAAMRSHDEDYKAVMRYLRETHSIDRKADMLASRFDEAMAWAKGGK